MNVHTFYTASEAYDASQTDEKIADGDVLYVPKTGAIAVLMSAWPIALEPALADGVFHEMAPDVTWDAVPQLDGTTADYTKSKALAEQTLREAADEEMVYSPRLWEYGANGPITLHGEDGREHVGRWVSNPMHRSVGVGDRVTAYAGAPGTGRIVHRITRVDLTGTWGVVEENTIRELAPWEVM